MRPYMSLDQPWCFGLSCRKEGDEKLKAAWRLLKAQQKKHKRRKRGAAAAKAAGAPAVSVGGRLGGRGTSQSGRPTVSVDGLGTAAPTEIPVRSSSPPPPPDEFSEHHLALQLARRVRGQAAVVG